MSESGSNEPDELEFSLDAFRTRIRERLYVQYTNYAFFIKGAVIAVAGLSAFAILAPPHIDFKVIKLGLWVTSFAFSIVTITTWSRGAAFSTPRSNALDVFFPLIMGMLEVMLFLVLASQQFIPRLPSDAWSDWYLVFGLFASSAAGLVLNRMSYTRPEHYHDRRNLDDDAQLQALVDRI